MRTILITGATGGLGKSLCKSFSQEPCRIAVHTYQNQHEGKRLLKALSLVHCESALFTADLKDPVLAQNMFHELKDRWGSIDLLINNAGMCKDRLLQGSKEEDWDEVIGVNLSGSFYCMREAANMMQEKGCGHIINISSYAAFTGRIGQSAYTAAKRGLIGLGLSAAREWGPCGIQVNTVCPGFLDTAMTAQLKQKKKNDLIEHNVLGRHSTSGEVAQFIRHLSNMEHVSGQVFNLDSRIA